MGKIYELYGPDERRIDNLKRRIRGYEKMKKDLTNQNKKLYKENKELKKQLEEMEELVDSCQKTCDKGLNMALNQKATIENYVCKNEDLEYKLKELRIQVSAREEVANKYREVIDKAIEIIKDNIPEEYVRSCDTADYIGRYELDTDTWQYKVYEMLKEVE